MTVDLSTMWDFAHPEISERRFRAALAVASGDDALILQTQIARTFGLRRDFVQAQKVLGEIESQLQKASFEAKAYYFLELGRSYTSATHPPESQTDEVRQKASSAYLAAIQLAQEAGLDLLTIDALHMLAFVETTVEDQIEWNRRAIAAMQASSLPEASKWAGPLHNNLGYALHSLGRYDEALHEFELALAAHQRGGNLQSIRIAHWMVAWTLRALGRYDEALEIQLRLEQECADAGEPDPYVFEELEHLYRALNDSEQAEKYAERRKAGL